MEHYTPRDHATSNVLAWTATHSANVEPSVEEDAGADADEPPDCFPPTSPISTHFHRTPIRRGSEQHESLLTRALQSHSDEDTHDYGFMRRLSRRRSITSTTSFASTADLTCGTGITTPARTSSPSPRLPSGIFVSLVGGLQRDKHATVQVPEKKRCISFACAAKPNPDKALMPPPPKPTQVAAKIEVVPKKTCIKFACPAQPPRETRPRTPVARVSPSTPKPRSSSAVRVHRSPTARRAPSSPIATRNKKWLTADSKDLQGESARFHAFASDELQEDDWIWRDDLALKPKLTIDDTLKKENAIRKLGKEAEEEAELEEEEFDEEQDEEVDEADLIDEEDADDDFEDDEDGDDLEDEEDDEDDEEEEDAVDEAEDTEHPWDEEASDGYKTDNEIGFAESDDEDDDLVLWTTRIGQYPTLSGAIMARRLSLAENSDSSTSSNRKSDQSRRKRRSKTKAVPFRAPTPELPDSTDFVCGTLDEDRPLEEAYISCVEARRRGRHQPIPQDIDPSFPTSDLEDEDDDQYKKGYGDSDDQLWLHGELEDLHHEHDRRGRKKKAGPSPKRFRSPPPKRRPSPAPKGRGRSPRKLSDQRSPRLRSPAPLRVPSKSPVMSAGPGNGRIAFKSLEFQPGPTQTKSLPKVPGMFPNLKARRPKAGTNTRSTHVRGAIDIVKGLEQKRQRRKEKFYQKYYNRARKEKAHTKRPPRGQGAERMREIGLFMAGKTGHGNYVLSI
ncbi:hypothetical protein N0V88_002015 [Collariella sp. IMI 366227]|nr:hypothetical protein N0V88_002015 [Collariella sp. IMI 366227]